ncbi:hypothetical protein, partial [Simiduia curdlanivorans]
GMFVTSILAHCEAALEVEWVHTIIHVVSTPASMRVTVASTGTKLSRDIAVGQQWAKPRHF